VQKDRREKEPFNERGKAAGERQSKIGERNVPGLRTEKYRAREK